MVSPSQRQSGELFRKTVGHLSKLNPKVAPLELNATSCTMPNGSRIVCLPGSEATVRGYSAASLVIVDEAAFVPDELFIAVRPMLAVSGGRLIMLSTPAGKRGAFFEAWENADFERVSVPASQCPRISPDFLEAEKRAMGLHWYRQEFECEFLDGVNSLISYETVQSAFSSDVKPLDLDALMGDSR